MAVPGFLSENLYRSYPFLEQTVGKPLSGPPTMLNLPNSVVVDCGFLIGAVSRFDYRLHSIRLGKVVRIGSNLRFEFVCNSPDLETYTLKFYRNLSDADYLTSFAEITGPGTWSSMSSSSSVVIEDCDVLLWSGYLTTGSLADINAVLPTDGELVGYAGQAVVEPTLTQNLSNGYLSSLSVANLDRTRATAPEPCDEYVWPFPVQPVYIKRRCMTGPVLLDSGYNVFLRQGDDNIVFFPFPGAGQGEPCSEIPITDEESSLSNMAGGPLCGDVFRSINGVGGRMVDIEGGRGVSVVPDPQNHQIVINIDLRGVPARWFRSVT